MSGDDFDALVAEAERAPVRWDFGWLTGRASEQRPSWHYFDRVAERAGSVASMIDLEAGPGHLLADLPALPALAVAAESYPPSVAVAASRLKGRGAHLVATTTDGPGVGLAGGRFELVTSRHPVRPHWAEIARLLAPGGTYFAQHVGPHSLRELAEHFRGPRPTDSARDPQRERRAALGAGLEVVDQRLERPEVVFDDVGAVVYFLRTVVWIVPDFSVDRYRHQLRGLHERLRAEGPFRTTSARVLFEARQPS